MNKHTSQTVAAAIGIDLGKRSANALSAMFASLVLRAGDWVRSSSTDGNEWQDVRSLTDLRWQVMQGLMNAENLELRLSDAAVSLESQPQRNVYQTPLSLRPISLRRTKVNCARCCISRLLKRR